MLLKCCMHWSAGLRELLKEEELKDAIILVLCTKQDKPNSMSGMIRLYM